MYDAIANLAPLRRDAAYGHARSLLRLEQLFHLDPEAALNHWLAGHPRLGLWAGTYYDNAHFVVTLGLAAWLWWRHPAFYRPLRSSLVLINVIGLLVFWVDPTAPPRLLDPGRYPDVVAATHAFGSWHTGTLATAANQLAAMPSLHVAWAVWSALVLWRVFGPRRWARLAWVYPAVTAVAVMATGNHFLLDVAGGVATTASATWLADRGEGRWTAWRLRAGLAIPARVGLSLVRGLDPPSARLAGHEIGGAVVEQHLKPGFPAAAPVPPPLLQGPGAGPAHYPVGQLTGDGYRRRRSADHAPSGDADR
jgi:hypothetical protein